MPTNGNHALLLKASALRLRKFVVIMRLLLEGIGIRWLGLPACIEFTARREGDTAEVEGKTASQSTAVGEERMLLA